MSDHWTEPELEAAPLIHVDEAPLPGDASAWWLPTPDGMRLRVGAFPVPGARGTVFLVTGWSEFTEKYAEVIADLRRRGFNVAMMDWRGQGLSDRLLPEREKGHIQTFGTHESDLRLVYREFVTRYFTGPFLLMGHSMGGCVSLLALGQGFGADEGGTPPLAGAIFSSPMTRLFPSPLRRMLIGLAARTNVTLGAGRLSVPGVKEHSRDFRGNNLTSDERRHHMFLRLIEAAPKAALHGPTWGWLHAAMRAIRRLNQPDALRDLHVPVLIVSSGNDKTVDGHNTRTVAARSDAITLVEVPDALHEVLMERDQYRDQFWSAADDFIDNLSAFQTAAEDR